MKRFVAVTLSLILVLCSAGCMFLPPDGGYGDTGGTLPAGQGRTDKAAYTILVYMNGSNLETDGAMASYNIQGILEADYSRQDINVVLETGGTKQWHTPGIPGGKLGRFLVTDQGLAELERPQNASMGDPATLTDFINFGYQNFPAERYALILWNHGGGSVLGFGQDEMYNGAGLRLTHIYEALNNSAAKETPFEFVGFDACLMATIETANILKNFARYLVASQETEPGNGWDYDNWLSILGDNPALDGEEIGSTIVDSFIAFYNKHSNQGEPTTLSVTDLSKVDAVTRALEELVNAASLDRFSFQQIARQRAAVKAYGVTPGETPDGFDLVDLGNMAAQFASICPEQSRALEQALDAAVPHSAMGRYVDCASGLSVYFPFYWKDYMSQLMEIYKTAGYSPAYYNYLAQFVSVLTGDQIAPMDVTQIQPQQQEDGDFSIYLTQEQIENIDTIYFTAWQHLDGDVYRQIYQDSHVDIDDNGKVLTEFDGLLTLIGGEVACLYEVDGTQEYVRYMVPAVLNGQNVDLIVIFDDQSPGGRLLGAQPDTEGLEMAPRELIEIKQGDKLAMLYYTEEFSDTEAEYAEGDGPYWYEGNTITVDENFTVETVEVPAGDYLYGFIIVDLQGNVYETDYIVEEFYYE